MKRLLTCFVFAIFTFIYSQVFANIWPDKADINLKIKPGETKTDTIKVSNLTDKAVIVRVYTDDFTYIPPFDGTKKTLPAGETAFSCAGWISASPQEFNLPPRGNKDVKYTLKVPEGVKGGYYGVLLFEEVPPELDNKVTLGAKLVIRIGTTFFLETSDSEKKIGVEGVSVNKNDISGELRNIGDAILMSKGAYYVMDGKNKVVHRGEVDKFYLPPQEKVPFKISLPEKISQGTYSLVLNFGFESGGSAVKELSLSKDEAGNLKVVSVKD